jgi:hypothetical protein
VLRSSGVVRRTSGGHQVVYLKCLRCGHERCVAPEQIKQAEARSVPPLGTLSPSSLRSSPFGTNPLANSLTISLLTAGESICMSAPLAGWGPETHRNRAFRQTTDLKEKPAPTRYVNLSTRFAKRHDRSRRCTR